MTFEEAAASTPEIADLYRKTYEMDDRLIALERRVDALSGSGIKATTLGGRVAELRALRGLSAAGLARLVDVSRSYVSAIEANDREPSLAILRKLAAALEVPAATLLEKTDA